MNDLELLYFISRIKIIVLREEREAIKKRLDIINKKDETYRNNIELCIQKLGSDKMKELKEIIEKAEHKYKIK